MNALRVLLIGESADSEFITAPLSRDGHLVLGVSNLDEGSEALLIQRFDAVLLAPEVSSEDAARLTTWLGELEQSGRTRGRTPVLPITSMFQPAAFASTVEKLANAVIESGADKSSGTSAADLPVFDPIEFEAQVAYDRELMVEIIDLFLDERVHDLIAMSEALAARDFQQLTRTAHTIKGSLSSLHAVLAQSRAQALEMAAKNSNEQACVSLLAALEQDLETLEPELLSMRNTAAAA